MTVLPAPRVAVLVIVAIQQPVHRHYLARYWRRLIEYTNAEKPDLDVFLLIEHGMDRSMFGDLSDNVIEDPCHDMSSLVAPRFQRPGVPSILSKTIHGFDVLDGAYDLFFRTNLSSMLRLENFERFVRERPDVGYAGNWVWEDGLRDDLMHWNWVGPDKSIADLDELASYPGNTFISGSGFFISAAEAAQLVAQRDRVRYDIADDVAIGLMLDGYELLPGFSMVVTPDESIQDMRDRIRSTKASHIRLQHFPVERAMGLWHVLEADLFDKPSA